jgi:imidazolonepropionase-like amidohydrolase/Tol biopolymer transport system component
MPTRNGMVTANLPAWDVSATGEPSVQAKFSVSEGTWMNLDISPDGKTLVFDLLGDIYSMAVEGADAVLIHGGPAMESKPRFSADGSQLLYLSDRGGSDNLWVSAADGSNARQVSRETVNLLAAPAWSPDCDYAAAVKFYSDLSRSRATEIWLYHLAGGQGRLLVETPANGKSVNEPLFSRDGRYLYYTENTTGSDSGFLNANQPIYALKRRNLSDGTVGLVVGGFGSATAARLSPDDKRLSFIRRVKDKTVLFVYDTVSGEQRPVYDGLDRDLIANRSPRTGGLYSSYAWFPDGDHVAIWSKGKIHKINMTTGTRQEIPFRAQVNQTVTVPPRFAAPLAPARFAVRIFQQVAPAPDGKMICFNALGRVWRQDLPAGKPERLTESADFEFEPSCSLDGTRVAYVSWDDETGSTLNLISTQDGHVTALIRTTGIIRQPSFAPDGQRLVYWLEPGNRKMGGYRGKTGLYWIAVAGGASHYIGPAGRLPQFSPKGERIYYIANTAKTYGLSTVTKLESVGLDGQGRRLHVSSDDASELRISPDLRWLAYKRELQYYLVPYRETGATLKLAQGCEEVPAIQLTTDGGYDIVWSADSSRVNWMLGQTFSSVATSERYPAVRAAKATQATIHLEVKADKPAGSIAFTGGRIITMRGEEVIESGTLVVKGNRIAAVGPVDQVAIPKDALVIDAKGKTLIPGLVDMHGHLEFGEDGFLMPQKHPSHYAALAFGVTTNFDPSATDLPSLASGELNKAGVTVGPRFITTGRIIYGMRSLELFHPIRDIEDARSILRRRKALGAIVIKSYLQPMRSQRQQLVKAAREAMLMVAPEGEGHFYNNLSMIIDGHMSVEHNFPLANIFADVIQLMACGSTSMTPTLVVNYGETFAENYFYQTTRPWDDPKVRTYVQKTFSEFSPLGSAGEAPPHVRGMLSVHQADELWEVGFRSVARSLKKLDDAGVVINAGSHGQLFGLALHWEMWALAQGGMSHHRVLRAATLNGARTLGLDGQIGSLEAGKLADLLVLDANPLADIRNTNSIRYTIINGRMYDSLTMNEIGNVDRPRGRFYWELSDYGGIDWNEAWGEGSSYAETGTRTCCVPWR